MFGKRLPADYVAERGEWDAHERALKVFEWERCTAFRATCLKRLAEKGVGGEQAISMDSVKRKRKKMMSKHK